MYHIMLVDRHDAYLARRVAVAPTSSTARERAKALERERGYLASCRMFYLDQATYELWRRKGKIAPVA